MSGFLKSLREIRRYPSAVFGVIIIVLLVIVSIVTVIVIPYDDAVKLWRGGEAEWFDSPKNAAPTYMNLFRAEKLPATIILNTDDETAEETVEVNEDSGITEVTYTWDFDYPYDGYPQELSFFYQTVFEEKNPFMSLYWYTPDGREIRLGDFAADKKGVYRLSQDEKLQRRLGGLPPEVGLFADPNSPDPDNPVALQGTYQLLVSTLFFEEGAAAEVSGDFVIYGQVHGLAGTDHRRRELSLALAWGTPVALAFGLIAAVGTTITTMIIAAVGVWYGGWIDETIQRITEVNLILPVLPILIMIGTFYSKSIWLMLGVIILLSIFGAGIKTYRAVFLQVKESPYIEAALAYGANNTRIIRSYMIPRIVPLLIPQLVVLVPAFVFLEASLAVLGLGDPTIPTWGKVINEARTNGALYTGYYYWMLQPAILLMITGLAFAMVGFSLDRIFNPRLRGL